MEIKEIENSLKKYYDENSVKMISNSIYEYQELYKEKYIDTKMVIDLVINNIPKGIILYDKLDHNYDAVCSITSGEFKVSKAALSDKDYLNYVFFHEFIHAISYRKFDNKQFMGFFTIENGEDYEFKSKALNEAFTEYMALERNELYKYKPDNKSLSGYDVGAEQLKILLQIIPKEELLECYFNNPDNLDNVFKKYNMNLDEVFYGFYALECMEYDIKAMEYKKELEELKNVFKIIDGERYLFYNYLDSFGDISTKEEFDKKWKILLSELDNKYNFYEIDGIFRYGILNNDIKKCSINKDNFVFKKVTKEKLEKYKKLSSIFDSEDDMTILNELNKIYSNDYEEYWDLMRDEFAIMAYTFLDNIKNNYQLYDIEIYPRVYPYLVKENVTIKEVDFEKLNCEEEKIRFYLFNVNNKTYVESNYDDTIITEIDNNIYEVKYSDQVFILDIKNRTYNNHKLTQLY